MSNSSSPRGLPQQPFTFQPPAPFLPWSGLFCALAPQATPVIQQIAQQLGHFSQHQSYVYGNLYQQGPQYQATLPDAQQLHGMLTNGADADQWYIYYAECNKVFSGHYYPKKFPKDKGFRQDGRVKRPSGTFVVFNDAAECFDDKLQTGSHKLVHTPHGRMFNSDHIAIVVGKLASTFRLAPASSHSGRDWHEMHFRPDEVQWLALALHEDDEAPTGVRKWTIVDLGHPLPLHDTATMRSIGGVNLTDEARVMPQTESDKWSLYTSRNLATKTSPSPFAAKQAVKSKAPVTQKDSTNPVTDLLAASLSTHSPVLGLDSSQDDLHKEIDKQEDVEGTVLGIHGSVPAEKTAGKKGFVTELREFKLDAAPATNTSDEITRLNNKLLDFKLALQNAETAAKAERKARHEAEAKIVLLEQKMKQLQDGKEK